jgi:hypothetical protein
LGIFWSTGKNFLLKLLISKNFVLFLSTLLVRDLLAFVSIPKHDLLTQPHQASYCPRAHDLVIELLKAMRPQILIRLLIALLVCSLIYGMDVPHERPRVCLVGDGFP